MTKLQLLERENKDLKTQVTNSKNQIRNLTEFIEEQRKAYESKIDKLDKRVDFLYDELDKANKKIDYLETENKELKKSLKEKDKEIDKLNHTITNLKARINKDSSNSSKPPSSDGLKKKVHSNREKTGRKPGGQKGHKGANLKLYDEPTNIVECVCEEKCDCGGTIDYNSECDSRKQKIDIQILTEITEYHTFKGHCRKCNQEYSTQFPEGINNLVQYGENLKTFVALLINEGMVSVQRTKDIVYGLTSGNVNLSGGTIININNELAKKSEPIIEQIKNYLIESELLFVDETGVRINGKLNWLHTACTEDTTLFMVDKKRGNDATENMGILASYVGVLMHDHLKAYYNYTTMTHAECNAHILRYLKSIIEIFKRDEAQQLLSFLVEVNEEKKRAIEEGKESFTEQELAKKEKTYLNILSEWKFKYEEAISGKKNISYYNDEKCLIERLKKYKDEHLLFINNFKVPFDNNMAERALRMIKTKAKVSGGFRSETGGDNFSKIRSVIDTVKKRSLNLVEILTDIFLGNSVTLN